MHMVIMAGGSGTRFWPASRRAKPKQFLNITGKNPMVVETCDRLRSLARDEEITVVLGREHLSDASEILGDRKIHLLAEPVGRNTAPCIGLAAIYIRQLGYEGPVAFMPADHFINDTSAFVESINEAGNIAQSGGIVTLGIVPTKPETGYGYIERSDDPYGSPNGNVFRVSAFVEKPDLETAKNYLTGGRYFWNAGIFVATPETILNQIEQHLPDLAQGLKRLKNSLENDSFERSIMQVYKDLEAISFDYGIMERTRDDVFVVPCECGWSDVGSWESLYELRENDRDKDQNLCEGGPVLIDCKGSFVSKAGGRMVACLGLKNCLVVDTPEALLVADLGRSQEIKRIVEQLKKEQKEELL